MGEGRTVCACGCIGYCLSRGMEDCATIASLYRLAC